MPELPEVETITREIEISALNQTILSAETHSAKIRIAVPENLNRKLKNQKIIRLERRAKYILIHLENEHILVIHLGMSGRIHIDDKHAREFKKHDHLTLQLSNGKALVFNDPRRFGLIAYMKEKDREGHVLFAHLGPEPLSPLFTPKFLSAALMKRKTPVKIAIMDQELVVGVGNIYASEALFEAGIDPARAANTINSEEAKRLAAAIKKVLKIAIKVGGSTLKDYRKTNGEHGYFQHQFTVYDQAGKPCGRCTCNVSETHGVQRMVQGGRSTFYCPRKQV